jgi:hypothetical protein
MPDNLKQESSASAILDGDDFVYIVRPHSQAKP